MGKQFLKYTTALIALYIGAANASGMGTVIREGAAGGSQFVRALQGGNR